MNPVRRGLVSTRRLAMVERPQPKDTLRSSSPYRCGEPSVRSDFSSVVKSCSADARGVIGWTQSRRPADSAGLRYTPHACSTVKRRNRAIRSEWTKPGLAKIRSSCVRISSAETSIDVSTVKFLSRRFRQPNVSTLLTEPEHDPPSSYGRTESGSVF